MIEVTLIPLDFFDYVKLATLFLAILWLLFDLHNYRNKQIKRVNNYINQSMLNICENEQKYLDCLVKLRGEND